MDSTIHQILIDTLKSDTIQNNLSQIQIIVSKPANSSMALLVPLLASIVGGLLVWVGQYIERNNRTKTQEKSDLLEIYAYCRKLEAIMRNNYRELAMAKTHVEYWWYAYGITNDPKEKMRFYEEHLKSQAYAREIERKIGETKADFISHVRKYQALKPIPVNIENELIVISDLTHPKAIVYDNTMSFSEVRDFRVEIDEKELRGKYYVNLDHFTKINAILQNMLTRLNL